MLANRFFEQEPELTNIKIHRHQIIIFLNWKNPSFIYGYVPRYISELVAKQGSLCENITITFTLSKNTSMHVL